MFDTVRRTARRPAGAARLWGQFRWYAIPNGLRQILAGVTHIGWAVQCPICGWRGRSFYSYGVARRPNALCPRCFGVERHRLLYLYLTKHTSLLADATRVLEIAPGPYSCRLFGHRPGVCFVGADLDSPLANCRSDIMRLPLPSNTFDLLVCYHVLEHVPDDAAGMREIHRVLRPGGTALAQVPIEREVTFEVDGATTAGERLRLFGQSDHVRAYGKDFRDRLAAAGFTVEVRSFAGQVNAQTVKRMALNLDEPIFACRKPL